MKKKKWKFTKSTANLATEEKKKKKPQKRKQKRKEDTRIRRFVARKKRANANGVAEETNKTLELRTPRIAEVW
jgi:hypothetical protein